MPRCIYCLEEKAASEFGREHVIPKQLGTFEPNNFVLNKQQVCRNCNNYFSGIFENALGRRSFEAYLRLSERQKSSAALSEFMQERTRITAAPPEVEGAPVEPVHAPELGFALKLPGRIGVEQTDGNYRFFSGEEFRKGSYEELGLRAGEVQGIRIVGQTEVEDLMALVAQRISTFRAHSQINTVAQPGVRIDFQVDSLIARAIAKIAFNYLTYWTNSALVLDTVFDPIRRFIRYGEGGWRHHVMVVLVNELQGQERRLTHGHIAMLQSQAHGILGVVSPFNVVVYHVALCRGYPTNCGAELSLGHLFDWKSKKIKAIEVLGRTAL